LDRHHTLYKRQMDKSVCLHSGSTVWLCHNLTSCKFT